MRGKSPFGGSRLTALIVALILAAAGALVNWMQSSKPAQDAGRPPAAGKPQGGAAGAPEAAMKDLIIKLPARAKSAIVGLWLGGCLLLAVFPPFYLAAGGQSALVLGMPLAIAYWLIDAVLLVAGIALLMRVERLRGEFGDELDNEHS